MRHAWAVGLPLRDGSQRNRTIRHACRKAPAGLATAPVEALAYSGNGTHFATHGNLCSCTVLICVLAMFRTPEGEIGREGHAPCHGEQSGGFILLGRPCRSECGNRVRRSLRINHQSLHAAQSGKPLAVTEPKQDKTAEPSSAKPKRSALAPLLAPESQSGRRDLRNRNSSRPKPKSNTPNRKNSRSKPSRNRLRKAW